MRLLTCLAAIAIAFSAVTTVSQPAAATSPSAAAFEPIMRIAEIPGDKLRHSRVRANRDSLSISDIGAPNRLSRRPVNRGRNGRSLDHQAEPSEGLRMTSGRSRRR
jgi:hypothetical protein